MDTQTQIDRLIELAIIQRSELKQLVEQLPQLRDHLNAEVEKVFDETEPQLRAELEEWTTKQTADKTAALGVALEAKIADLAKSLEISTQARYNAIIAEREENARLAAQAEAKIAEHAASLPSAVKEIVTAELARFPRAGEIDQLRKEFAEPRGLNPRGKWQAGETYNKLDLVTINGDSYTSNTDGNRTRPSRSSADWTLVAARGTGGGGGPTSLSELTTVPSDGDVLIGSGTSWVTSNLTAGAGISITVGAGEITISATDGDITLDDGTAASPSLHFTNDADTGIYRPSANTLGISTSGVQRMYVDENGITTVGAGGTFDGSVHAANGNANNPSFSFTSDQDTGFYRHGTNELGISIGGTEKAVMTSTTFTVTPNLVVSGTGTINGTSIPASKTLVVTTDKLSALASTSSSELAGVISDETGTGALVFANTPTLVTPNIGAATGTSFNLTGSGTLGTTLTVNGTTDSSSKDTGAIITEGGLGVEKSASIGGNLTVGGAVRAPYTADGAPGFSFSPANDIGISTFDGTSLRFAIAGTRRFLMSSDSTLYGEGNASSLRLASTGFINLTAGGTNQNITLTPSGTGNVLLGSLFGFDFTNTRLGIGTQTPTASLHIVSGSKYLRATISGTPQEIISDGTRIIYYGINGDNLPCLTAQSNDALVFGTNNAEKVRLFANGNLGIGTGGTDGGQKLQVSGTGYFSAGITIGGTSDVGTGGVLWQDAGSPYSTHLSGANIKLETGSNFARTTALTLDSSQNATFAGTVNLKNYVQSTITGGDTIALCGNDSTNTYYLGINYLNNRGTETIPVGTGRASWRIAFDDTDSTGNMVIGKRSGGAAANSWTGLMTLTQGGNATFTGSIAIGNTVNTVSPTSPNRTVTIVIGGTTYYLAAKTTND